MNEIEVRIRKMTIYEVTFDRSNVVVTLPWPMYVDQLAEMEELTRHSMGWSKAKTMITINSKNITHVRKRDMSCIQAMDITTDEDGNEVEQWWISDYVVANRFQIHQSSHRHLEEDCGCGVVVMHHDHEGVADKWAVTL